MSFRPPAVLLSMTIVLALLGTDVHSQRDKPQDNASRKSSGNLLRVLKARSNPDPLRPTGVSTSKAGLDPRESQNALLPLRIRFLIKAGEPVPESIRKYLTEGTQGLAAPSVVSRTFSMSMAEDARLEEVVNLDEVVAIEIERPPVIGPEMDVHPRNLAARNSHKVGDFDGDFPDITGQDITALIIDEGAVRKSHVEFKGSMPGGQSRVEVNTSTAISRHATHVAGTMGAAGRKATAKGMSPSLKLISEDWNNDLNKLAELAPRIRVSNHSYGSRSGWDKVNSQWYWHGDRTVSKFEDSSFGKYLVKAAQLDEILFKFPTLASFVAAGNDRNEGPNQQPIFHLAMEGLYWVVSEETHRLDGFDNGGLDTITGMGLAKNAICIGSIDDITASEPLARMVSYSSWGPADDGRIKPDLVANGHVLLSTSSAGDEVYYEDFGTSMASPVAAGIGALMVQLLQRERPQLMDYSAAVIKAVLIHTATDDNELPGPDPKFGWGSINAFMAGRVIGRKEGGAFRHYIKVHAGLSDQQVDEIELNDTGEAIKATLVWIDPQGNASLDGLDDATPALQNDLDLVLIAPDGKEYFPYRLDRANPLSPAKSDGPNRVDNVEVVVASPLEGKWKVRVKATSFKKGPTQRFALVVSGLRQ